MRLLFADSAVTDTETGTGTDLDESRADHSRESYREWRRTRVMFMRPEADAEGMRLRAAADLPPQRTGAAL